MQTIWRSLLWREWHEHRWKLAALAAIMFSLQLFVIVADPGLSTPQIFVWVLCGAPGAFFLGLHAAAGERSGRTLEFVRAFPAGMRRFAIAKLAMGAVASIMPVLGAMLLTIVWLAIWRATGGEVAYREAMFTEQAAPLTDLLLSGIAAAAFSLSVFLWTAAAGMNQPTELRAAAAGIVIFIGLAALTSMTLAFRALERHPTNGFHPIAWEYGLAAGPAGSLVIVDLDSVPKWQVILLQLVMQSAVAWWALVRFGRIGPADNRSPLAAPASAVSPPLAAPRVRPWRAMAWKQWREAAPLGLAGAGLIVGMTSLYATLGWLASGEIYWSPNEELFHFLNGATVIVGTLAALVVGTASFAADVQPGLWTFWRSRPIPPALWFWPKYFAGAAAVLAFLDLPLAALYLAAAVGEWRVSFPQGVLACAPLLHLLAYSFAVCGICWVRRAIYAGILAFAAMSAALGAPVAWTSIESLNADHVIIELNSAPIVDFADFAATYLPFASVMLGLTLAAMLLAWSGVKHEQGLSDWEGNIVLSPRRKAL